MPILLYRVITSQKSSWRSPLFQPVNFADSRHLATTLWMWILFGKFLAIDLAIVECNISESLYTVAASNSVFFGRNWDLSRSTCQCITGASEEMESKHQIMIMCYLTYLLYIANNY